MRRTFGTAVVVVGVAVGCSKSGGSSGNTAETVSCDAGTFAAGDTCIASYYLEADMPLVPGATVNSDWDAGSYTAATLLVVLRDAGASPDFLATYGGTVTGQFPAAGLYRASFADAGTSALLSGIETALKANPSVKSVLRDVVAQTSVLYAPARPRTTDLETLGDAGQDIWAYGKVKVFEAWNAIHAANPKTSPVVVGILDGFVEKDPFFSSVTFVGATDFRKYYAYDAGDMADENHGTMVATIIGAPSDGVGPSGIVALPECVKYSLSPQAVTGNFLGARDGGPAFSGTALLLAGIFKAVRAGARVVSMSLGWEHGADVEEFRDLYQGVFSLSPWVLFVAAAGNNNGLARFSIPSSAAWGDAGTNVMSIAAVDKNDTRSSWSTTQKSNYQSVPNEGYVTLAAPGTDVLSQYTDGTLWLAPGTSAATPMVSGVAALLFAMNPAFSGADVRNILVAQSDTLPIVGEGTEDISGRRLNAEKAVLYVLDGGFIPANRRGTGTCFDAGTPAVSDTFCGTANACKICLTANLQYGIPWRVNSAPSFASVPGSADLTIADGGFLLQGLLATGSFNSPPYCSAGFKFLTGYNGATGTISAASLSAEGKGESTFLAKDPSSSQLNIIIDETSATISMTRGGNSVSGSFFARGVDRTYGYQDASVQGELTGSVSQTGACP